jgi:hypothetical protein
MATVDDMEEDDEPSAAVRSGPEKRMELRALVLVLARAVTSGAFPEEMSVNLLMLFTRCGNDVDQVLRHFHRLLRQRLADAEWRVILRAMVKQFEVALDSEDSAEMSFFVALSQRFSRSFVQMAKVRQQMIWLLLQGIEYGCRSVWFCVVVVAPACTCLSCQPLMRRFECWCIGSLSSCIVSL